jgi:hypothetical protein
MASELRVNTLKDASGNNSVAMTYVAEGTAKSWGAQITTSGTAGDTFNISSITDLGSSENTIAFTSSFGSVNYSPPSSAGSPTNTSASNRIATYYEMTSSSFKIKAFRADNAGSTTFETSYAAFGDLA